MSEKIITLANLSNSRAQLLKARLANENVEAYLTNLNQIQGSIPAANVKIQESDFPVAMRIIREIEQEYGPDEVEEAENEDLDRILVPVDFSGVSKKAAGFATSLASKIQADIRLLHTYFNPSMGTMPFNETTTYQDALSSYLRDIHVNAKTKLIQLTNEVKKQVSTQRIEGVDVDYFLTMGDPAAEILRVSKTYKPNVIIMPIRHEDGKDNSLISSVTAHVIEAAKAPVLALPEQFTKQKINEIKNILYITNHDKRELKSIKNLMRMISPLEGTKVHVLHLCDEKASTVDEYQLKTLEEFFKRYKKTEFTGKNLICKNNKAIEQINQYIKDNDIDIISLVTHKRNLITRLLYPSMARKLVFHVNTPLLVFPAES
ncbi:MAG: universal stress protein [Bacteroidales bacterium]